MIKADFSTCQVHAFIWGHRKISQDLKNNGTNYLKEIFVTQAQRLSKLPKSRILKSDKPRTCT